MFPSLCSLAVHTAPCVPQSVHSDLDCLSGVLNITWQQDGDAHHFHATVRSSEGHTDVCDTEQPSCVVRGLRCGLSYSFDVVAHDEDHGCNSSSSAMQEVTAGRACIPHRGP